MTREEWLEKAVKWLTPRFEAAGYPVPPVKVSCSWPGGGSARKRIGECWPTTYSAAGINEIFISPRIADPVAALDILVHEMVHAVDNCKHGHRGVFVKIARAVGLEGKPTATHAGPSLKGELVACAKEIGPYPHATLDLSARKKQTTRNLKCECPECGAVWRMTQRWLSLVTCCPVCAAGLDKDGD